MDGGMVAECKRDLSNIDWVIKVLPIAEIRNHTYPLLELVLEVQSELAHLWYWIIWVVEGIFEVLVHLFLNVKFYGIVSCSNCFYIVLDILILADCSHVVEVNQGIEVNED